MKALIVEDEPASRMRLKTFIEDYGDTVDVADGETGVTCIKDSYTDGTPFDVVCLDIKMPGMDGHEVLEAVRALEDALEIPSDKRIKILMTTALNDGKSISKAFYGLCDEYISKPVRREMIDVFFKKYGFQKKSKEIG